MRKINKKKIYIIIFVINILGIFTYFQISNSINPYMDIVSQELEVSPEDEDFQEFGNIISLATIFYPDDRELIHDTTMYPFSAVCKIFARFPNGKIVKGSGAMIDGFHVLTAGHCLYISDFGG